MITVFQAIILGLLQGISELFPVSSLGHSVILPQLLGWPIHQNDTFFLTFLIATHLATATVLFIFFFDDWKRILTGIVKSLRSRDISDPDARLGWLLVVGTIPAGIIGLLFEQQIRNTFVTARSAALFLALNGLLLLGAEYLRKRAKETTAKGSDERISRLSWTQGLGIGAAQAIALIPGFSRSGSSIGGGLLAGLSHEDAARFGFLLATPVIGAAAVLKLPELATSAGKDLILPSIVGAICSAAAAYVSIKFLVKYFETKSLRPFGIYCLAAGIVCTILFWR